MFEVDALFVFPDREFVLADSRNYQLVGGSGRPIVRVGAVSLPFDRRSGHQNSLMVARYEAGEAAQYISWINSRPRTNYRKVNCAWYDRLEYLIISRQILELVITAPDGHDLRVRTGLLDTKTHRDEEYVQLSDTRWIRMDRVVSLEEKSLA